MFFAPFFNDSEGSILARDQFDPVAFGQDRKDYRDLSVGHCYRLITHRYHLGSARKYDRLCGVPSGIMVANAWC